MFHGWKILPCLLGGLSLQASTVGPPSGDTAIEAREIHVGYAPNWVPFSYQDERGRFAGFDADVLRELARRLSVTFVPRHSRDWQEAYALALAGEVQVLTGVAITPEREAQFLFTRPYGAFPLAIVTRVDEKRIRAPADLDGRRVASARDYVTTQNLRREHPGVEIVDCANTVEAFHLLAGGQADAVVTNLVNASHVMRQEGLGNLRVAWLGPATFQLRLAVRRDLPGLHRALDAAIASLSRADQQALIAPYVQLDSGAILDWHRIVRWFVAGCAVLVLLIAAIAWHNLRLRAELDNSRRLRGDLEASHRRLETLNEEKTGLLRMAAHDLRNPLTSLLMSLEIARNGPESARFQALALMGEQARRMHQLIQNLLDVEALKSGRRELRRDRVDAREILAESRSALEPEAQRKQILLGKPVGEGRVLADRSALRQVCDNLLSNAVKYSSPGSTVRLLVQPADEHQVRLSVLDQGPGIPADELPLLFQKFARLSPRPTGGESSTGLGLAIVKELVERMGGRVWCQNLPDRGAGFHLDLPSADAAPGPSAPIA